MGVQALEHRSCSRSLPAFGLKLVPRVTLKGCYKGTLRVPLKGSIRVMGSSFIGYVSLVAEFISPQKYTSSDL